jgi:hypothetical protein
VSARATLLLGGLLGAACGCRGTSGSVERLPFALDALGGAWRRVPTRATAGYYQPALDAVIMANRDCERENDAPLTVLTNTLLIGFTERQFHSQRLLSLAGREALRSQVSAKLDGVPLMLDVVVLKKDGCAYDLVYLAPPAQYPLGRGSLEALLARSRSLARADRPW